jgi:acetyl esterase/lipase
MLPIAVAFNGPARYRIRTTAVVCHSALDVCLRRSWRGPRLPGWNWAVELTTRMLKEQLVTAFKLPDIQHARLYLDSMVLTSPAQRAQVTVLPMAAQNFRGAWFLPKHADPRTTLLYLHGGGYSFYPKAHANLITLIALAANCRTFALDYRLTPEHPFPAQLEDALHAYRGLLAQGIDPQRLVIAGDSAGGNLALALLLAARDSALPLPALAALLSPPTDFNPPVDKAASFFANEPFDWISPGMLLHWADWFCPAARRQDPLVSPLYADLRGLPPIYIQAGSAEILCDSIRAFAARARQQGAQVALDIWPEMNHDFQMFGYEAPQSAEALQRLGRVIANGAIS